MKQKASAKLLNGTTVHGELTTSHPGVENLAPVFVAEGDQLVEWNQNVERSTGAPAAKPAADQRKPKPKK